MTQLETTISYTGKGSRSTLAPHVFLALIATGAFMLPALYAISMAETRFALAADPSWLQQVAATLSVHIPAAVLLTTWWRGRGRPWPARAVLLVAGWFVAALAVALVFWS